MVIGFFLIECNFIMIISHLMLTIFTKKLLTHTSGNDGLEQPKLHQEPV